MVGLARMAVFPGWGLWVLRRGWKARRARHDKSAVADELLLLRAGLLVTLLLLEVIFWSGAKRYENGSIVEYLGILLLIAFAAALTYGSDWVLRRKRKRPGRDQVK